MLVAIDLSMRSAGLVSLTPEGKLGPFKVLSTTKQQYDDEQLLIYVEESVSEFIASVGKVTAVVIEGLALNAKSQRSDLIAGNHWSLRKELRQRFPDLLFGVVPVETWRSKVIGKKERADLKELLGKDYLKQVCVSRLPSEILDRFTVYIEKNELKRDSIYDLTDAYWLGRYRLSLGNLF